MLTFVQMCCGLRGSGISPERRTEISASCCVPTACWPPLSLPIHHVASGVNSSLAHFSPGLASAIQIIARVQLLDFNIILGAEGLSVPLCALDNDRHHGGA